MFWLLAGVVFLIVDIRDLVKGNVWVFRSIYRDDEPVKYWFAMGVYLVLTFSCFIPYIYGLMVIGAYFY